MGAANAVWHAVFQRLLEHLLHLQEGGRCSPYMHPDTRSVKCAFSGANPSSDVVCVWDPWLKPWCASMGTTGQGSCLQMAQTGFDEPCRIQVLCCTP